MMVCVSKSFAGLIKHPLWFQIAYRCFRMSFPYSDSWDDDCNLPDDMNFAKLKDLYVFYFFDMSAESRLFTHFGIDILADWIAQPLRMPPDPLRNLPFYLDVLRLGGFFRSFYARQRLKAVVRVQMEIDCALFSDYVQYGGPNMLERRDSNIFMRYILQGIIRCEFILRIADMFCITNCADNSIAWTNTLMHNPTLPRVTHAPVLDIPESGVRRLNELFEHVLLNPTLENLHLIFYSLIRSDARYGRILLHLVERNSTSVPSFVGEGRMRQIFAHFHYSVIPHLGRIALGQNPLQYDFPVDHADAIPHQLDETERLSESDENEIWRSTMIRCQQHPMWGTGARSIEFYLGEDWRHYAVEVLRSRESPPQSPGAAPDESDPRITPEDGE
jgi:hypothetical protein